MRRRAAISVVAAFFAVAALAVPISLGSVAAGGGPARVAVDSCVKEPVDIAKGVSQLEEDCLTSGLYWALMEGNPQHALDLLSRLEGSSGGICHKVAHAAGELFWPDSPDWTSYLDRAAKYECTSGVLHGFLHTGSERGALDWDVLVAWCQEQDLDPMGDSPCAHATGHAAYVQLGGRVDTPAVCDRFIDRVRRESCSAGVSMEELLPLRDVHKALIDLDAGVEYLCSHIPANDSSGLRNGCAGGVGTGLVGQGAIRAGARDYVAPPDRPMFELLDLTREYIRPCLDLGPDADQCVESFWDVLRDFSGPLNWDEDGFMEAVCGPEPELMQHCEAWVAKRARLDTGRLGMSALT